MMRALNRDALSTAITVWVLLRYNLAASNCWTKDYSEINRRITRREFQEAVETFTQPDSLASIRIQLISVGRSKGKASWTMPCH